MVLPGGGLERFEAIRITRTVLFIITGIRFGLKAYETKCRMIHYRRLVFGRMTRSHFRLYKIASHVPGGAKMAL